ncbi:MAG: cytochrome c biogenesis protein CcdA [Patescibacteria group bacterium]|jgi:cytochrome c biogenesis protein CcdA
MKYFRKISVFILLITSYCLLVTNQVLAAEATCKAQKIVIFGCDVGQMLHLNAEQLTLPIVIVAGLIDGINPCAIGLIILLLGYLIIFVHPEEKDNGKKFKEILKIGGIYIVTVFLTYLLVGIFFYKFIDILVTMPYFGDISLYLKYVLAFFIILAGLINIKDFWWHGQGFSLEVSQKRRWMLTKFVEKASIPSTIILGILVTLFEMPCSLPLYVGSVSIIHDNLGIVKIVFYLILYNLLFVLPLVAIWVLVLAGRKIAVLKEWQESKLRTLKLIMGITLVIMGIILVLL